jgi:hypothetical protein
VAWTVLIVDDTPRKALRVAHLDVDVQPAGTGQLDGTVDGHDGGHGGVDLTPSELT